MSTSKDYSRFYVAQQYIQAASNLISEMIRTENRSIALSSPSTPEKEIYEQTKHGSNSVIMPALFCLYQGLELILKGFIVIKKDKTFSHDAENLLVEFKCLYRAVSAITGHTTYITRASQQGMVKALARLSF